MESSTLRLTLKLGLNSNTAAYQLQKWILNSSIIQNQGIVRVQRDLGLVNLSQKEEVLFHSDLVYYQHHISGKYENCEKTFKSKPLKGHLVLEMLKKQGNVYNHTSFRFKFNKRKPGF